jgi:flagellar hook-length control protein FliK
LPVAAQAGDLAPAAADAIEPPAPGLVPRAALQPDAGAAAADAPEPSPIAAGPASAVRPALAPGIAVAARSDGSSEPPGVASATADPVAVPANIAGRGTATLAAAESVPAESAAPTRAEPAFPEAAHRGLEQLQSSAAPASQPGSRPVHAERIDTPVAAPRWGEDFAQRVVLINGRGEHRAELTLIPPQMGRVEVSLTVNGFGETSATFVAATAQAREAIEQALPRLREAMAEAGMTLGQASVSADSAPREQQGQHARFGRGSAAAISEASPDAAQPGSARPSSGLVDTFA